MVRPRPGQQTVWFTALYTENCVQVLKLLTDDPSLLTIGRREDKGRVVEGPQTLRSFWKGRTALHVGARRGSVDLVKTVVRMFDDSFKLALPESVATPTQFLEDMLTAKDGWYNLDALAMAVVNGNRDIILLLAKTSLLKCETNPYEISNEWEIPAELHPSPEPESRGNSRMQLRQITEEVVEHQARLKNFDAESLKSMYTGCLDFNFLPWQEFLFHFTFIKSPRQRFPFLDEIRQCIFDKTSSSPTLRRFLCDLQDGQGRTPLHVAVDEGMVIQFLVLIPHDGADLLTALDGTGKMPLHRAAAKESPESLRVLLGDGRVDLQALYTSWYYSDLLWTMLGVDLERVSKNNGFKGYGWFDIYDHSNALHIAIIHKRRECVRLLLDEKYNSYRSEDERLDLEFAFARAFRLRNGVYQRFALEPLQLAAVLGDAAILESLLQSRSLWMMKEAKHLYGEKMWRDKVASRCFCKQVLIYGRPMELIKLHIRDLMQVQNF
ncbi:unnamed protein product [Calypogeia fissa]